MSDINKLQNLYFCHYYTINYTIKRAVVQLCSRNNQKIVEWLQISTILTTDSTNNT